MDVAYLEYYVATKKNLRERLMIWKDDYGLLSRKGYKTKMSTGVSPYLWFQLSTVLTDQTY